MKVVLTIARSESSTGAGIQADLKTFESLGVFGTSAMTAVTTQNTAGVVLSPLNVDLIEQQIQSALSDFDVAAIKIGMLYDKDIIKMVHRVIEPLNIPIVLNPVCISKAGSPLLNDDAIDALRDLSRIVTLTTPNLHEAYRLFGYKQDDAHSIVPFIEHPTPVLIKHHVTANAATDLLYSGHHIQIFTAPLIDSISQYDTGYSYSSAITANLALGLSLETSIEKAKKFITHIISQSPNIGHESKPINHKPGGNNVA
jgi:hydroxymethylpyrimidine/phosphomethylpyrimidine kinase